MEVKANSYWSLYKAAVILRIFQQVILSQLIYSGSDNDNGILYTRDHISVLFVMLKNRLTVSDFILK